MRRTMTIIALGLVFAAGAPAAPATADGSWIDGPGVNWNQPGMAIPAAQPMDPAVDPRCLQLRRPPETFEDKTVAAAGWTLWGSYQAGWGMVSVKALSGFDGMCRPMGFQEFVFVDGVFAGTISPVVMDSRADGAGAVLSFTGPDGVAAVFRRYKPEDPLCCPSAMAPVTYTIDRGGPSPVLVPTR